MKILINTDDKVVTYSGKDIAETTIDLYTKKAFELISKIWLKVGWNQKYIYTFSWFGRPVIQLPEDLLRIQEVIYRIQPDIIVETGIAHGGSLIFYASLCKAMDKGRVVGVDIEIRPHNREAIEKHQLSSYITLIEGDSVSEDVVRAVKSLIKPGETVLVILDSNHTHAHVLAELTAYHELVSSGSYIVATDGIMKDLYDVPRGKPEWIKDNPAEAAMDFLKDHSEFVLEQPDWTFNESELDTNLTHWPSAWLRRKV